MLIGYARVSTADQDVALQTDALTKAGCERLFTDKASGAKAEALHFARAGDCIVVWKLDRLGRSIQGLISLAADLSARKLDFRSLTDGFDTSTASGRLLFHIFASVAEMERELIKERTVAGLAAARKKGGIGSGRKSALTPDKLDTARKLLAAGDKPAKVAKLLQVGLSTFYRHFPAGERAGSYFVRTDRTLSALSCPYPTLGERRGKAPRPLTAASAAITCVSGRYPSGPRR